VNPIGSISTSDARSVPVEAARAADDLNALSDAFQRALGQATDADPAMALGIEGVHALIKPFVQIDAESAALSARIADASGPGGTFTPSEVAMLTVRCHEFMFHCQLTSSLAHLAADGMQQLLRQPA
jgi:hypothetical protein